MKNSNPGSDTEIIIQVRQGDASAFRVLVERYQDASFSLACSILHNEHDAEDALQEAFIKAYRSLGAFRAEASFATWLYRIVLNTCLNMAGKRSRHVTEDLEHETSEASAATGLDKLIDTDRAKVIGKVLGRIKDDEALLLRLFYLLELDVQEIMTVTGFKESKVKVTLFRARKSFAEQLRKISGHEWAQ